MKLSSYAYTEGMYRKPRIDDDLLAQYSDGIIATTTCLGSRASQLILNGENKAAENLITHHKQIFKDRFTNSIFYKIDSDLRNKSFDEIEIKFEN